MAVERLQKVLAAAGVASRRGAEELIVAGRVTVDGRPATLGERVDPEAARIELDGRPLRAAAPRVYLACHKPAGVTSTARDPHAASTVLDLVPRGLLPQGARLFPVGRLDRDSEGLIILTSDGEWADRVLHPRHGVEREYALAVGRMLDPSQVRTLQAGIPLEEGLATLVHLRAASAVEIRQLAAVLSPRLEPGLTWYRVTLAQGRKRQIRRMFGAVGAPVVRLVRVRVGQVRLGDLASGEVRPLSPAEVRRLPGGGGSRSPC